MNLPVVFLTGYGFTAQENLAFEAGAVDFIDKARGVEILARRLRRLVRAPKAAAQPRQVSWSAASSCLTQMSAGHIGTIPTWASVWSSTTLSIS